MARLIAGIYEIRSVDVIYGPEESETGISPFTILYHSDFVTSTAYQGTEIKGTTEFHPIFDDMYQGRQ